jgi:hypothetical protein
MQSTAQSFCVSRCANPRSGGELLDYSLYATAAQVEARCHQLRNAQRRQSTVDANQVHSSRYLRRFEHDNGGTSDLPVESVRRITCDASLITVVEDQQGNPLNVGRKNRGISPPMKRTLLGRDKCCRFLGCRHDKRLDAHHVMHWADGGDTSTDNILLLCSAHHRVTTRR